MTFATITKKNARPALMVFAFFCLLSACSAADTAEQNKLTANANPSAGAVIYENAYWYSADQDEPRFIMGDRYAVDGVFVAERPENAKIIDLAGNYIIPPFGEAHNHSIESLGTKEAAKKYINEGTFYYKNPNSVYTYAQPALDYWAQPDTLDVTFSYGGLSKDEGHPEKLYRQLSRFGMYSEVDADDWEGNAFYDVDSQEKLNEKWPTILDKKPDFLKLYLLNHDTNDSAGLQEPIFREIVSRANALGIRTTVHVETVQDLELAVNAGATEAAHLPAYNLAYAKDEAQSRIPDTLVALMADKQFIVVTTTHVSTGRNYSDADYTVVKNRQANNIKRLYDAGVPLAIGSDTFFDTARNEIETLRNINALPDRDLLQLWMKTPSVSIFPDRAIGKLIPDFEASFLSLKCNPLENLECVDQIQTRVKQGQML